MRLPGGALDWRWRNCARGHKTGAGILGACRRPRRATEVGTLPASCPRAPGVASARGRRLEIRSEEHTSELQSLMRISYAVFCLKKKKQHNNIHKINSQLDTTHNT